MNDRSPRRFPLFVAIAVSILVLVGATAAFASGALESDDSGFDSPRDRLERGLAPPTTSTSVPVDDRVLAPSAAATPMQTETFEVLPDGSVNTFAAGPAGSVTVRRDGASLSVVSVTPNAGWRSDIEQPVGIEVEVNFEDGVARVDFNAELEDGLLRVRVRGDGVVAAAPPAVPSPTAAPVAGPAPVAPAPGHHDDHGDDHSGPRHGDDGDDHSGSRHGDDGDDHSGRSGSDDGPGHH